MYYTRVVRCGMGIILNHTIVKKNLAFNHMWQPFLSLASIFVMSPILYFSQRRSPLCSSILHIRMCTSPSKPLLNMRRSMSSYKINRGVLWLVGHAYLPFNFYILCEPCVKGIRIWFPSTMRGLL